MTPARLGVVLMALAALTFGCWASAEPLSLDAPRLVPAGGVWAADVAPPSRAFEVTGPPALLVALAVLSGQLELLRRTVRGHAERLEGHAGRLEALEEAHARLARR